jgi:hypothetical protein
MFSRLTGELVELELREQGVRDALLAYHIHVGSCCCCCCAN